MGVFVFASCFASQLQSLCSCRVKSTPPDTYTHTSLLCPPILQNGLSHLEEVEGQKKEVEGEEGEGSRIVCREMVQPD